MPVTLSQTALMLLTVSAGISLTFAQQPGPRPGGPGGGPGGMMRMLPVMQALDENSDGEISAQELANASAALAALDKDGNGKLTLDELRPAFRGFPGPGGRSGPGGANAGRAPLDPDAVEFSDGAATIPDRETYKRLSYQGSDVLIDTHLKGLEYVKFQIEGAGTDDPRIYFINTKTHRAHMMFMNKIGLPRRGTGQMRGVLVFRPMLKSPSGKSGLYTYEFEPNDAFPCEMVQAAHDLLVGHSALLKGSLAYYLLPRAKERYLSERDQYKAAGLEVVDDDDLYKDIGYLPLHPTEAFGRLRLMALDERPGPRDIVIYPTLPNEMPRVAGIITGVRQTPLSHVNLRAIQDNVPNAFIADVSGNRTIGELIGSYVYYKVAADGYEIREATATEVNHHFVNLRPAQRQTPARDLSVTGIRPLDQSQFADSSSIGGKSANLAVMRTFGFREDLVPDGFAVPFYFYDQFMRHNGFYAMASEMTRTADFQKNADAREAALGKFRKTLKKGKIPAWMMNALSEVQNRFPRGTSIRCRSSTNTEDLPGFSGAGLYDSYTHHPDEGHLSKSIKQVFASMWNYRAYEEREFYRISHFSAAMGVLLHPNSSEEQANGVAVTEDIVYQTGSQGGRSYYINAQVGEDLVTNPDGESIPEEILLSPRSPSEDRVVRRSNRVPGEGPLLSVRHLGELRESLGTIHRNFRALYHQPLDAPFAMEVEFKITSAGRLSIKQARPWVYQSSP